MPFQVEFPYVRQKFVSNKLSPGSWLAEWNEIIMYQSHLINLLLIDNIYINFRETKTERCSWILKSVVERYRETTTTDPSPPNEPFLPKS